MRRTLFAIAALVMILIVPAMAQSNPTPQSLPYTQDFSGLAWTSTTYPAGWQGWTISTTPGVAYNTVAPTADRALTASSTAATTSGNVHNYSDKVGYLNTSSLDLMVALALNTTGYQSIQISYDIMTIRNPYDGGSNTRINEVSLQYRVGTSGAFTTISGYEYQNNTTTHTSSDTNRQNPSTKTITLPAACDNQSVVQLRWASRQASGGGSRPSFAVDNVSVSGSPSTAPTITVTGSLTNFGNVAVGGNSSEQTYTVAGSNLTADIAVTAPTNFQVDTVGGTGFASSLTLPQTGGTVPTTTVRARFSPGGSAYGAQSGDITHTSTGASTVNQAAAGNGIDTEPTTQPTNLTFADVTYSSMTVGWTRGATPGDSVIVTARAASDLSADPADGADYAASATYGSGTAVGGGYVVYKGVGTSFSLTGLVGSTTYYFRAYEYNDGGVPASANYNTTAPLSGNQATSSGGSAATDHFRSAASGNWNVTTSWQSSADSATWIDANLTPDYNAASIAIQNGHTVALTASVTADQLLVLSGGVLNLNTGAAVLTVANGAGDDVAIASGGILRASGGALASFNTGATMRVLDGGMIEAASVTNTPATYANDATAAIAAAMVWDDGSVFNWNVSGAPSFSGRTYFPNADAATAPIFRTSNNLSSVGGASNSTINGVLEANAATTSFTGTGLKIFRNGITGSGPVTQLSGCGQFRITGAADLGGSGALALDANGLTIASTSTTTLTSNKTIDGATATVTVDGYLDCVGENYLTGTAAFALSAGGTLGIGSTYGLSAIGNYSNIRLASPTFDPAANFVFTGDGVNGTGDIFPTTVNDLTINLASAANTIFLVDYSLVINGTLTMTQGLFDVYFASTTLTHPVQGTTANLLTSDSSATDVIIAGTASGVDLPSSITYLRSLTVSNSNGTALQGDFGTDSLHLVASALAIGSHTLALNGTLVTAGGSLAGGAGSNLTVGGSGANISIPSISGGLNNLTLNRANGMTLGADLAVAGALALTSGVLTTGGNTLTAAGTSSRTAGYVDGNLRRYAAAGSGGSLTYMMGVNGDYSPLAVTFGNVTTAGYLTCTAKYAAGGYPNASDALAASKRYWNLVRGVNGTDTMQFDTCAVQIWYADGDFNTNFTLAAEDTMKCGCRFDDGQAKRTWWDFFPVTRDAASNTVTLTSVAGNRLGRTAAGSDFLFGSGYWTLAGTSWTGVGNDRPAAPAPPAVFALTRPYPNPARGRATFNLGLPEARHVRLEVFNLLGQRIALPADRTYAAGTHQIAWDLRSDSGQRVSDGVYFYRLSAGEKTVTGRLTVLQ